MKTKEAWSGEFGNEYTKRNWVDWQARIPFWKMIIDKTGARSAYEFGCNAGWNLSAIQRAFPDVQVCGYDVNEEAAQRAREAGLQDVFDVSYDIDRAELVFTAGVLIHIPPKALKKVMKGLLNRSYDYVLAVEYDADEETEVEYRDGVGLWKRPYGKLYQDLGLKLIETGIAVGFDNCRYHLLQK